MPSVKLDNLSFVHIPRSAGTSIGHWLKANKGSSSYQEWYNHPTLEEMQPTGTTFTVVRNPWDRIVSLYQFSKNVKVQGYPNISNEWAQNYINQLNGFTEWPDFETWVINLENFKMPEIFPFTMLTPQTQWADNVDSVLHYETLDEEFITIQQLLNCYNSLLKENSSERNDYKYMYTSKTKDLIYKWFKEDVDKWRYEF
jgi:hypothetical protein